MTPETLQQIAESIQQSQNLDFVARQHQPVSGGDINQSYLISDGDRQFFVKINHRRHAAVLEAEYRAVKAISEALASPQSQPHPLRIPEPVALGNTEQLAYLVLEYLPMAATGDARGLAAGLVALHQTTAPNSRYGWEADNFIGTSPQRNAWSRDWNEFWFTQRLQPQLEMAYSAGYSELQPLAERLQACLPDILQDHNPQPSLLHGDLWGGNAGYLEDGTPVIFDPASYYGDREADLAMTELFGGFSQQFYQEYRRLWPLDEGYDRRKRLYNLYHLLNHLNLFGRGYLSQCRSTMTDLVNTA